jgi:rare lipoprotein A
LVHCPVFLSLALVPLILEPLNYVELATYRKVLLWFNKKTEYKMETIKTRLQKFSFMLSAVALVAVMPVSQLFAREKDPVISAEKTGIASWYGGSFHGRKTANGDVFNQAKLTCASNHYPLGSWLKITNLRNGKTVIVLVNDRMHPRMKRVVDLSRAAAKEIGIERAGVGKVKVELMSS